MWIDTHCHLNEPSFRDSLPDVLKRAREEGVMRMIVPAYDESSLQETATVCSRYPGELSPAFGLHPWYLHNGIEFGAVERYTREYHGVALGEIGLDFSPGCPDHELQFSSFIRQLEMAISMDLPVIVHSRKAYGKMYEILHEYRGRAKGVIHSFSGGVEWALKFIEIGFHLSFSGSVTRANAKKYHKTAQAVPQDWILIETDAPSISTQTTKASQVEPRHVVEIARTIARLRNVSEEEVGRFTTQNAVDLFSLLQNQS